MQNEDNDSQVPDNFITYCLAKLSAVFRLGCDKILVITKT